MKDVVIAGACRTPIARFQGSLESFKATELGALAVREALARAGVAPEAVEECILGNVLTAGLGQNPARQAAIGAGIPPSVGSFTVNKVCGSGLKAVMLAAQAIRAGDHDVIVAGGMESMTNAPYLLPDARKGTRLGHSQLIDSMVWDGLWDIHNDFHMGITAEMVADEHRISRAAQDEFAAESHRRAAEATAAGRFDEEKFTLEVPQRKGDPIAFDTDENIRPDTTAQGIARMRPAFKKDGTVTVANASSINDGASAMVVMSAEKADELGVKPMARILGYATGGLAPEWVMMAPEVSIKALAGKLGREPTDFDLHEINEAFSAAACALLGVLDLDPEKVNVNGGAVALGHPIGASGARILTTLLHAMKQRGSSTGMASLCLGGGNAVSVAVEAL
ncbi:MAG: acetyl-CoA C-acetyltransferase [Planctomycetota bacterium]|nr:acetyl-CoA C-acetyltransferase [Planctomycetota bacterium]